MSLHPYSIDPVPQETARVARAAFPKGNRYMTMRDELEVIYPNALFADLYPQVGHYGEPPWRLALVTLMQFSENLTDRQAADAGRGRIDWKYALGLELPDPGFDFSVLSEFRMRLIGGAAEERLLTTMLDRFTDRGLLKNRGYQRTDSTPIVAAVRSLNRLEIVGETLHAALNAWRKLPRPGSATTSQRSSSSAMANPSPITSSPRAKANDRRWPKRLGAMVITCSPRFTKTLLLPISVRLPPSRRCARYGCSRSTWRRTS